MKQLLIAAGLGCCAVSHSLTAGTIDAVYVDSPLKIHTEPAPAASRGIATRLQLDVADFADVGRGQHLFMEDFPLGESRRVTLQLEEASALAHDAKLVVMQHDNQGRLVEVELPWPTSYIFRGTVVGEPTSTVFLSVGEKIANGWISIDGTRFVIGTRYADGMTLIYDEGNVPEGMINWARYECGVSATKEDVARATGGGDRDPGDACPQVKIAIDTDYEFTSENFDGNATAAADYVNALVSAVAGIYKASVSDPTGKGISLKLQYLRLWSIDDDPWTGTDTGSQLAEFSDYWRTYMGGVDRHLAHLLNARELGGGMAFLNGLCSDGTGYAVSGGMAGTFPMPLEGEQDGNWDPIVFAHETGHNFGMIHTHDAMWPLLEPTIDDANPDECGNDDCAGASGAPIMSYCHLCEGGIANIAMEFDDGNAERAELFIESLPCNFYPDDPPILADDHATTDMNTPVQIHVLDNDVANDCNTLSLLEFDRRAVRGGRIELLQGSEDVLVYTPTGTIAGTDSFTYTAVDGSGNSAIANVVIQINRPPTGGGGGGVDPNDVIFVITLWGSRTADCTGDGITNVDDLLAVLEGKAKPNRR